MSSRDSPVDAPGPGPDIEALERQAAVLREANEHLVLATIDAQKLSDAAARTNLRQEQFLATLAHELRNPLAPIRTANAVLGLVAAGEPRLQKLHEIIDRQVKQMARLLDDLLDVARMTSGKIKLQRRPVAIREFLEQAIETGKPLIDERAQLLTVDIPAAPIHVDGDPVRLTQVFCNLLHNAAKYTKVGGAIALTARLDGEAVVIRVTDNGTGIAPDLLPRIFDLFSQASHPNETAQGGLGLGLTVVRRMVEMHGGTVVARSAGVGKGSEFVVTLPLLRSVSAQEAPGRAEVQASPRQRGYRITLIDDNVDANSSLQLLLQLMGHEVSTASDGASGLVAIHANRPQIVVCDIGLPDMDGYTVATRVRAQIKGAMPVMIALTGFGQESDRDRALAAGFDHHLVKPVDPQALLRLIAEHHEDGKT
ncbi:MAG: hybrid sensor histidine kinase/response regulator [Usitatibacter sp.]